MSSAAIPVNVPQFITVPNTGIQIFRQLSLSHLPSAEREDVWKAAKQAAEKGAAGNPMLPILYGANIACDQKLDSSGWIACDVQEAVFFRMTKVGPNYTLDMVIDTRRGAGHTAGNRTLCAVAGGGWFRRQRHNLAEFYVEPNVKPRNVPGSLIVDFGNTATGLIFAPVGSPPEEARPIKLQNPFDPYYNDESRRPSKDASLLKATAFLLYVPRSDREEPWLVMGQRADEMVAGNDPLVTSLFAPKKYVRHWADDMKALEPTTRFQGLVGRRDGLVPNFEIVRLVVKQMLEMAIATLTNPNFGSVAPAFHPQITNLQLTYPLTWREEDKELFRSTAEQVARETFVQEDKIKAGFKVELIASEPVAVAAYVLWRLFFHFLHLGPSGINLKAPSLPSAFLGNTDGSQHLRLLMVDIGGGSTDIALIELEWETREDGDVVDITYRVDESLRFNRAGDRISHILATAILKYMEEKYGIREQLDFSMASPTLPLQKKRQVISKIMHLVEEAKARMVGEGTAWTLGDDDEKDLKTLFETAALEPVVDLLGHHLEISLDALQTWLEQDRQGPKTQGVPGFMDIFEYLRGLNDSLRIRNKQPHLVILSGRTTRLPFIKSQSARNLQLPLHRVVTMAELMPDSLKGLDAANMDKLAVVYGAHLIRNGYPVRFTPQEPRELVFRRILGTVVQTPVGLKLNKILAQPGEEIPMGGKKVPIRIGRGASVLIGHAFRQDGGVEVLATLSNHDLHNERTVDVELKDDYNITMKPSSSNKDVSLLLAAPGGTNVILDNFNDTGKIDCEPEGFLREIVLRNKKDWIKE